MKYGLLIFLSIALLAGTGRLSEDLNRGPGYSPIGGIIAIMPAIGSEAWQPPADCSTIKDGFMRTSTIGGVACTVPTCPDCIIPAGTTLPNLYHSYIRGDASSGGNGGSSTQNSGITIADHTLHSNNIPQISGGPFTSGGADMTGTVPGDRAYGSSSPVTITASNAYLNVGATFNDHSHNLNFVLGSSTPSAVTHSITDPAVNNEPEYQDVVWVMRVK